jgi:glyoxylase-like metal-dependent hydrolase (beta-lactamase superfamily II)
MAKKLSFGYIKAERFFKDGERLGFGTEMRVIPLASHCKGHVGFYFPEEKILYSGVLFDPRCADGASIVAADSSYEQAFEDIDTVLGLDVEILAPGHGPLIRGRETIRKRLLEVKEGTKAYASKILSCLPTEESGGLAIPEIAGRVFDDSNAYNAFSRRIISYHVLCRLQGQNLAACKMKRGRSFFYALEDVMRRASI